MEDERLKMYYLWMGVGTGSPATANFVRFCIFLVLFSLTQGFLGGSKPRMHCNGSRVDQESTNHGLQTIGSVG